MAGPPPARDRERRTQLVRDQQVGRFARRAQDSSTKQNRSLPNVPFGPDDCTSGPAHSATPPPARRGSRVCPRKITTTFSPTCWAPCTSGVRSRSGGAWNVAARSDRGRRRPGIRTAPPPGGSAPRQTSRTSGVRARVKAPTSTSTSARCAATAPQPTATASRPAPPASGEARGVTAPEAGRGCPEPPPCTRTWVQPVVRVARPFRGGNATCLSRRRPHSCCRRNPSRHQLAFCPWQPSRCREPFPCRTGPPTRP